MIDFGLCTEYLDQSTGKHIAFGQTQEFVGNMAFSSKYAMDFSTQGRRDDLISLSYLLLYLRVGQLDFLDYPCSLKDPKKIFEYVCKRKHELTPHDLCSSKRAKVFFGFMNKIHSMHFEEEPDYKTLKQMLLSISDAHLLQISNN